MSRNARIRLLVLPALLAGAAAAGQQSALEPVDQTIEDISVLAESLREIETGLGHPSSFSRVYRARGAQDRFMRVQGGLYAVFPESVYGVDHGGHLQPLVPNDTIFYIGPPALLKAPPPPDNASFDHRLDGRIRLRIAPDLTGSSPIDRHVPAALAGGSPAEAAAPSMNRPLSPDPAAGARTIVSDADYRAHRLQMLMRRAAAKQLAKRGQIYFRRTIAAPPTTPHRK
jgi:hypothetical protein